MGYSYDQDNNDFLFSLLSYHIAVGNYTFDNIQSLADLSGRGHAVIATTLQGDGVSLLEAGNTEQVLVCSPGPNGTIQFPNQPSASVLVTYAYNNLLIYVVDQILGYPGSVANVMKAKAQIDFEALRVTSGTDTLDDATGFTAFMPLDSAFDVFNSDPASAQVDKKAVISNHVSTLFCCMLSRG